MNRLFHRMKEESLLKKIVESDRLKEFNNINTIKKGLVFWVADENEDLWFKKLADCFPLIQMDKLCFVPKEFKNLHLSDSVVYLRNEDLGFRGKIKNVYLGPLLTEPYDVLIDLTTLSNGLINYVLRTSRAACKVGFPKSDFEADLIIDAAQAPVDFIEKLHVVLSQLKKY